MLKIKKHYFGEEIAREFLALLDTDQGAAFPTKLHALYAAWRKKPSRANHAKLNECLAGYQFRPYFTEDGELEWVSDPGKGWLLRPWLELAQLGLLDQLQQCRKCGEWFFAVVPHMHYCSKKCRDQFQQKDPKRQQKRKKYMRWYYQQEKNRKWRSK